jgi:hypothetical protein
MTVRATFTCDACKKDLTFTSNAREYRLALMAQPMLAMPGNAPERASAKASPLEEPLHFCDVKCLKSWATS